jgi:hypothetical protein
MKYRQKVTITTEYDFAEDIYEDSKIIETEERITKSDFNRLSFLFKTELPAPNTHIEIEDLDDVIEIFDIKQELELIAVTFNNGIISSAQNRIGIQNFSKENVSALFNLDPENVFRSDNIFTNSINRNHGVVVFCKNNCTDARAKQKFSNQLSEIIHLEKIDEVISEGVNLANYIDSSTSTQKSVSVHALPESNRFILISRETISFSATNLTEQYKTELAVLDGQMNTINCYTRFSSNK